MYGYPVESMRKNENVDKDFEFSLKPVNSKPIATDKVKYTNPYYGVKYPDSGECWDMLHNMMRDSRLQRYTIFSDGGSLVCDIDAPIFTPKYAVGSKPTRSKEKTLFVDLIV